MSPGLHKITDISLSGLRQIHIEATDGLRRKSTVCGLTGFLPAYQRDMSRVHSVAPKASKMSPAAIMIYVSQIDQHQIHCDQSQGDQDQDCHYLDASP